MGRGLPLICWFVGTAFAGGREPRAGAHGPGGPGGGIAGRVEPGAFFVQQRVAMRVEAHAIGQQAGGGGARNLAA